MNAYKDFHAFTYISLIKTCVRNLVSFERKKTQFRILVCKNSQTATGLEPRTT